MEYREKNNIKRNDFLDLLITMKNKKLTHDKITEDSETPLGKSKTTITYLQINCLFIFINNISFLSAMSLEVIAAQCSVGASYAPG